MLTLQIYTQWDAPHITCMGSLAIAQPIAQIAAGIVRSRKTRDK